MNRIPLVGASILSVQLGAAIASSLFGTLGAPGTVLLRQGLAAAVLVAIARPNLAQVTRRDWRAVCAFGLVLAAMNVCFYEAVDRLPLGIAVTIELFGPLGLAAALVAHGSGMGLRDAGGGWRGAARRRDASPRLDRRGVRARGCSGLGELHPAEPKDRKRIRWSRRSRIGDGHRDRRGRAVGHRHRRSPPDRARRARDRLRRRDAVGRNPLQPRDCTLSDPSGRGPSVS